MKAAALQQLLRSSRRVWEATLMSVHKICPQWLMRVLCKSVKNQPFLTPLHIESK